MTARTARVCLVDIVEDVCSIRHLQPSEYFHDRGNVILRLMNCQREVRMTSGGRGRRPAGSGTREAIVAAARRQFGELGYQRASLRSIAAEARVDPRLVLHFFGSKQELFASVVELPFDLENAFDALMDAGAQVLGHCVATILLS